MKRLSEILEDFTCSEICDTHIMMNTSMVYNYTDIGRMKSTYVHKIDNLYPLPNGTYEFSIEPRFCDLLYDIECTVDGKYIDSYVHVGMNSKKTNGIFFSTIERALPMVCFSHTHVTISVTFEDRSYIGKELVLSVTACYVASLLSHTLKYSTMYVVIPTNDCISTLICNQGLGWWGIDYPFEPNVIRKHNAS